MEKVNVVVSVVTLPASLVWMSFALMAGLIIFVVGPTVNKLLAEWNRRTKSTLESVRERRRIENLIAQQWASTLAEHKSAIVTAIIERAEREVEAAPADSTGSVHEDPCRDCRKDQRLDTVSISSSNQ